MMASTNPELTHGRRASTDLPRLLQIEACLGCRVGTLTVRRRERRAQKEVVGMPTLSLLDDACGMWES